jgi:Ca2+-binding RTX toxin-like protein
MAIFDFRGQDGREVIAEAYHLSAYTSGISVLGESLGFLFNDPSLEAGALPPGWREVTFEELGIDLSHANTASLISVGDVPFFKAEGLLDGDAKVLAKVDADGNIIKLSINFGGTNNIGDIVDFNQLSDLSYADGFEYLYDAVRDYAVVNDLSGEDVLFTGYSLGGGATNLAFLNRADYADGFFTNSDYIGFASPVVLDDPSENLFNFGFENDVVYRAGGSDVDNPPTLAEVVLNGTADIEASSSLDNLVLFNDSYAGEAFPYGDFNILNLVGWLAHLDGGVAANRLFDTIASSNFYDKMEQDSTIILSNLDLLRDFVWVEPVDRATGNHEGDDSFILGSLHDDLLGDSTGSDFLDGFAGNDEFRVGEGNDTVHGGAGTDTVNLNGSLNDYEIIRLNDGATYFYDTKGRYGIEELIQVEKVDLGLAQTYSLDAGGVKWGPFEVADYDAASEGTSGADTLSGGAARDRIFGRDGNDTLAGGAGNDLLHGGEGSDRLSGGAGNDQLFGAAGNDVLSGGAGNDTLSGGLGVDIFTFGGGWGDDIITDYNMGEQGDDLLEFSMSVFASFDAVRNAAVQSGGDVLISFGPDSLTLQDTTIADLHANDFLFV